MQTINETKKASKATWFFLLFISTVIIYGAFTSHDPSTKYWLGIPWTVVIIGLIFQKKTLKFTFDNGVIILEKSHGLLNKIQRKEIGINEIKSIKVWQIHTNSDTKYRIDFIFKDKTEIIMPFIEINKRAEIIKILKSEIITHNIKLIYSVSVNDNATIDLNEIVFAKFNLTSNKFNKDIYFDGNKFSK